MITNVAVFLLGTAEYLIVFPALLRFYLQLLRAPARNQLSNFVIAVTDFAVKPLRKIIPGINGVDVASLVWAWLAETLLLLIFVGLVGGSLLSGNPIAFPAILFISVVKLLEFSIQLLIFAIIVQAIMSWVAPYNPLRPVMDSLLRPFVRPFQRIIPLLGGVDLSSLVLLIVCQLLLMVPIRFLLQLPARMSGMPYAG